MLLKNEQHQNLNLGFDSQKCGISELILQPVKKVRLYQWGD